MGRGAAKALWLTVATAGLPLRATADPGPPRVVVFVGAPSELARATADALDELFRARGAALEVVPEAALDPRTLLVPPGGRGEVRAWMWLDLAVAGTARLYALDPAGDRALARTLTAPAHAPALLIESAAQVLDAALGAILAGADLERPRAELRAELSLPAPVPTTEAHAPEAAPMRSSAPTSPAPRSPGRTTRARGPDAPARLAAVARYAGALRARDLVTHGPELALAFEAGAFVAALTLAVDLPAGAEEPLATVHVVAGRAIASAAYRFAGLVSLELGAGVEVLSAGAVDGTAVELDSTGRALRALPLGQGVATLDVPLTPRITLGLRGGALFAPARAEYSVAHAAGRAVVRRDAQVRPTLAVGLAFALQGDPR